MKRLPLLITALLIATIVGGYFAYEKLFAKKANNIWDLVPETSVVVFEKGSCAPCTDSSDVTTTSDIVALASILNDRDTLLPIRKFLNSTTFDLISFHVTKKDQVDVIYYQRNATVGFEAVADQWKKNKNIKISAYEFNAVQIQEARQGNVAFSWALIDGMWVGSFTPFLIEDVVRAYEAKRGDSFKHTVFGLSQMPTKRNEGILYVNLKLTPELIKAFTRTASFPMLQNFGKGIVLDVKKNKNAYVLNGFSTDSSYNTNYALSIFSNQTPVPFRSKGIISNRTVFVHSFGVSNGPEFQKNLFAFHGRKTFNDTLSVIEKSMNLSITPLVSLIKGELDVCFVEKGRDLSQIAILETTSIEQWTDRLNAMSSKLSIDSVFFERYAELELRELPLHRFVEKLFWPLVTGFDHVYYTNVDNKIIFAEDLQGMKDFLEDVENEETWGKSVEMNRYLESTLLESNISLYVNTPRAWNVLTGVIVPSWNEVVKKNRATMQSLGMGAVQFSHLSENFYTNVSWEVNPGNEKSTVANSPQRATTNIGNMLKQLAVFRSHVDKTDEALVQDSLHVVHLVSANGKVLWDVQLDGPIQGEIQQIDYYKNNKLQFFFATRSKVYIIDRLGESVEPFPVSIPQGGIQFTNVIDYDHSRKYRFMITTKAGDVWMIDKEGNLLDGWKPKAVGEDLVTSPRHYRIRGKDYIIAVTKSGKAFVFNRRGEGVKKFPIDMKAKPAGDIFLENAPDIKSTYFVVVSKDGFKIKFNIDGEVQSRETLIRPTPTTQFSLVAEQNRKSYVVVRQTQKELTVMDDTGKEIIQNEYVGQNPIQVTFNDFGAGNVFISITDVRQDLSYVYDSQGNLLTTPPIESAMIAPRFTDKGKQLLFYIFEKNLTIQSLN